MVRSALKSARTSLPVKELSEDIRVAILEFLERHPGTSSEEILQAIKAVERELRKLPQP